MNAKKTCHTCEWWSPTDSSLDGGWRIFGTCRKPVQYALIKTRARHAVGWSDDAMQARLKEDLRKAVFTVQSGDDDVPGYLRTGMDFGCNQWESADKTVKPREPSITSKE